MKKTSLLTYFILIMLAVVMLLPLIFIFTNSFMSSAEIADRYSRYITPGNFFNKSYSNIHFANISFIPYFVTGQQYVRLFFYSPDILVRYWYSIGIAVSVVVGQLLISVPAAYAFESLKIKHKEKLFFAYIIVMLMPLQVTLVQNYLIADALRIVNTYWAIILPGIFAPFGTFLIRQQLKGFPQDYFEAAQLDGATHFIYFTIVILPMAKPTIAALAILTFAEYWNLVDQAVVFIRETWREPLSVFLSRMSSGDAGIIFATAVFYLFPAIIIYLFGQKQMVQGIQLSGLKA